ncbi:MAG: extracellular solute-binding protein [Candidatus Eremiobacteraeota bacterium]|nr:extracellular solute-binding protein [Candidatus Eremiobacteraeota bacterium]MBV9407376.1 extracellular solute-binding protein [Candidatus Eremiobacteraeota bacterium]
MKQQLLRAALGAAAIGLATSAAGAADTTVVVLCVSNGGTTFKAVAADYEKTHPGTHVQVSLAGSTVIAAQMAQGAAADLVIVNRRVAATMPQIEAPQDAFADHTAVVIPKGSTKVRSARDLAAPGVRLAGGTAGSFAETIQTETIARLAGEYGPVFAAKVKANVVTTRTNFEQIARLVESGSVDAAIVYASEITPKLGVIAIGDRAIVSTFAVAVVKGAPHAQQAHELAALMLGPTGQMLAQADHHDALH